MTDCEHSTWYVIGTGPEDADGIETPYECEYRCKQCQKVLATGSSCISDESYTIFDRIWGKKNMIKFKGAVSVTFSSRS